MAKLKSTSKRVASGRRSCAATKPSQDCSTQGATKPARLRGRSNRIDATSAAVDKPKSAKGAPRISRIAEAVEALTQEHIDTASKTDSNNNNEQADNLMEADEESTATSNQASADVATTSNRPNPSLHSESIAKRATRSKRIDDVVVPLPGGSNPAKVISVPRPRARFATRGQSQNLGIVLADLGNYTTTASRVLGLGEIEDIDFWNGAAAARSLQIRTRAVARKGEDGTWSLEFGPDTDLVCEKEGEVVIFDNMKLAMNSATKHAQVQRAKEKEIGLEGVYRRFIQWLFRTIFDASKTADPDMQYFRIYTGLPAEWPEIVSHQYQTIIENVPGWEGKVEVHIISEPTAAVNGRLKSLTVEQRRGHGVHLEDTEYGGVLDIGDATVNITTTYSERYQPAASATVLLGFGNLNRIVEEVLSSSEWLRSTFGDHATTTLQIWMQTTFLTKYKPTLGSGQQRKLEINNHVLPAKLADEIEEKVVSHFDSIIDWSTAWFIKWTKCAGIALKWIATSGGGASSVPFQNRFNGQAGPYTVFHNPKNSCGEDVLDGLKQQPHIRSTIQDFQFNYGLPQDLPDAVVRATDKPQHVLVIGEKGNRVPDIIASIPYYIPQPPDGDWEIDLTILKSDRDLSGVELTKGLDRKEVSVDGWTELPSHKISLPFNTSFRNFKLRDVDVKGQSVINGYVYILIELRGVQFVIHAIGRLDGKEDVGLRNSRTIKRLGYGVDEFGDTSKYFHVMRSTPITILQGTEVDAIEIGSEADEDDT